MEAGFMAADSDNLPKVTVDMVVRFLVTSAEIKGKCSSGESYGDRAIRFVQIKRDGCLCTVKCRVTSVYRVTAVVDEAGGVVQSCRCEDCAGCSDACKHAPAFLLWLHRRSEEPPVTPTICYWESLTGPGLDDCKFITMKNMFGIKRYKVDHSRSNIFNELLELSKGKNRKAGIVRYVRRDKPVLSVRQLCAARGEAGGLGPPEPLLQALAKEITLANDNCSASKYQTDSTLEHEIWYGRIRDSMLHEAVHCPDLRSFLVGRILGEDLEGIDADDAAREKKIKQTILMEVSRRKKIHIKEAGPLLNAEYPVLGAAPDGVADEYTVHVICPATVKAFLSHIKDRKLSTKLKTQVQAQMYFGKKTKALLCIAHPDFVLSKEFQIFHVYRHEDIVSVLDRAQQFWVDSIFPRLREIYNY